MALVTMQDVLKVAEEKKIAIAAFTVDTLEVAEEIASVAEEKQLPAIMMVGQNTFKYNKLEKNCKHLPPDCKQYKCTIGFTSGSWRIL